MTLHIHPCRQLGKCICACESRSECVNSFLPQHQTACQILSKIDLVLLYDTNTDLCIWAIDPHTEWALLYISYLQYKTCQQFVSICWYQNIFSEYNVTKAKTFKYWQTMVLSTCDISMSFVLSVCVIFCGVFAPLSVIKHGSFLFFCIHFLFHGPTHIIRGGDKVIKKLSFPNRLFSRRLFL